MTTKDEAYSQPQLLSAVRTEESIQVDCDLSFSVVSYNLFPPSPPTGQSFTFASGTCCSIHERNNQLLSEITLLNADIYCFQDAHLYDFLLSHLQTDYFALFKESRSVPNLTKTGCAIFVRKSRFNIIAYAHLQLDDSLTSLDDTLTYATSEIQSLSGGNAKKARKSGLAAIKAIPETFCSWDQSQYYDKYLLMPTYDVAQLRQIFNLLRTEHAKYVLRALQSFRLYVTLSMLDAAPQPKMPSKSKKRKHEDPSNDKSKSQNTQHPSHFIDSGTIFCGDLGETEVSSFPILSTYLPESLENPLDLVYPLSTDLPLPTALCSSECIPAFNPWRGVSTKYYPLQSQLEFLVDHLNLKVDIDSLKEQIPADALSKFRSVRGVPDADLIVLPLPLLLLSQPSLLPFKSPYKQILNEDPPFTHFSHEEKKCVDYMLFSSGDTDILGTKLKVDEERSRKEEEERIRREEEQRRAEEEQKRIEEEQRRIEEERRKMQEEEERIREEERRKTEAAEKLKQEQLSLENAQKQKAEEQLQIQQEAQQQKEQPSEKSDNSDTTPQNMPKQSSAPKLKGFYSRLKKKPEEAAPEESTQEEAHHIRPTIDNPLKDMPGMLKPIEVNMPRVRREPSKMKKTAQKFEPKGISNRTNRTVSPSPTSTTPGPPNAVSADQNILPVFIPRGSLSPGAPMHQPITQNRFPPQDVEQQSTPHQPVLIPSHSVQQAFSPAISAAELNQARSHKHSHTHHQTPQTLPQTFSLNSPFHPIQPGQVTSLTLVPSQIQMGQLKDQLAYTHSINLSPNPFSQSKPLTQPPLFSEPPSREKRPLQPGETKAEDRPNIQFTPAPAVSKREEQSKGSLQLVTAATPIDFTLTTQSPTPSISITRSPQFSIQPALQTALQQPIQSSFQPPLQTSIQPFINQNQGSFRPISTNTGTPQLVTADIVQQQDSQHPFQNISITSQSNLITFEQSQHQPEANSHSAAYQSASNQHTSQYDDYDHQPRGFEVDDDEQSNPTFGFYIDSDEDDEESPPISQGQHFSTVSTDSPLPHVQPHITTAQNQFTSLRLPVNTQPTFQPSIHPQSGLTGIAPSFQISPNAYLQPHLLQTSSLTPSIPALTTITTIPKLAPAPQLIISDETMNKEFPDLSSESIQLKHSQTRQQPSGQKQNQASSQHIEAATPHTPTLHTDLLVCSSSPLIHQPHANLVCVSVLAPPTREQLEEKGALPSSSCASQHIALKATFAVIPPM